jgi:hypothetical protein
MAKIEHSKDLGGLVPLEGWYVLGDDDEATEAVGPFATEEEARAYAEPNFPFSGSF